MSSKLHVQAAEDRIEFLEDKIEKSVGPMRDEIAKLAAARDAYVIAKVEASDSIEVGNVTLTKVVGHRRSWNPEKLQRLLPTRLYKLVIDVKVNSAKLDELVREGKIDRKKIEAAYEEVPNKPYVKRTVKGKDEDKAADEADKLKEALA